MRRFIDFMELIVKICDYVCLVYRVAQKSKLLPNDQKIGLKPANNIRFIRQITVWIKHYNIIRWN